jgi:hypothetical protein
MQQRSLALLSRVVPLGPVVAGLAEIDAELAAVDDLLAKNLLRLGGAGNVDEVCVGEASGLAGPAVDGNTDVHDIANVAEEVVQVLVRHLEGHVANEESLRGRVGNVAAAGRGRLGVGLGPVELADEVAALEDLHVQVVDGGLGVLDVLEVDVSEST